MSGNFWQEMFPMWVSRGVAGDESTRLWKLPDFLTAPVGIGEIEAAVAAGAERFEPFVIINGEQGSGYYPTAVGVAESSASPRDSSVCLHPFPPSLVARWAAGCYALWLIHEPKPGMTDLVGYNKNAGECDPFRRALAQRSRLWEMGRLSAVGLGTFLPIPGVGTCHALRWRPDLRYTLEDMKAGGELDPTTVDLILRHPSILGKTGPGTQDRIDGELEVVQQLRDRGVPTSLIDLIFREQPIGDPYRPTASVVGGLTMLDDFIIWVIREVSEGAAWTHKVVDGVLWFPLSRAWTYWQGERMALSEPALGLEQLARAMEENTIRLATQYGDFGHMLTGPSTKRIDRQTWTCWGICLADAERAGFGTLPKPDRVEVQ